MSGRPGRDRSTWPLAGLAGLALALLAVPVVALLLEVPWTRLGDLLARPAVRDAIVLSAVASLAATAVAAVLGVPLAWWLARQRGHRRRWARALVMLPMVLPPVVGGVALLLAFGRTGLVGAPLAEFVGVTLPFTLPGVVLAEAFVALPFLVITVDAGLRSQDPRLAGLARTLGADEATIARRVTLPLAGRAIGAGLVLAWARALGEFGATITFAGSLQGRTRTVPLAVFLELQTDPAAAYLLSAVMLIASVAVLVGLRDRWWPA